MELVAVDPDTWRRLLTVASGLSRTVQASLDKLSLLMTETGLVRSAVTKLRLMTRRSRSTISDHLGDAQETGWLTCVSRGGHRADGATTSVYQASVPRQVWERREELLARLPVENPDEALVVVFRTGDIIAGHNAVEPTSEFPLMDDQINPSIKSETPTTADLDQARNPDRRSENRDQPHENPVIAMVIEELAAHTGHMVDAAWAARVVSQIIGHRRVKHPLAYVATSLHNAAKDGTITARFLPARLAAASAEPQHAAPAAAPDVPEAPRGRRPQLGVAPWERDDVPLIRTATAAELEKLPPFLSPKKKSVPGPVQPPLMAAVPSGADTAGAVYRPEKQLAGLRQGGEGAAALAAYRAQAAARKQERLEEAMTG